MEELIKFPKTKPKSLIPHQCFLTQSDFKDLCASFVQIFGDDHIKWHCDIKRVGVCIENGKKKYKYIKHKNRSQDLFEAFSKCLIDVKAKLIHNNDFLTKYQKWSQTINKFKPKEYSLLFRSDLNQSSISPPSYIENIYDHKLNKPNQEEITRLVNAFIFIFIFCFISFF